MAEGLSLYQVLGCKQGALFAELRACFKRRALSVHPDKGGSKEAFQQVLAAFETLADPVARATYDRNLRQLLQRLPPAVRKAVIGEIPQNMRRALELWMLDRRSQATRTDPEVSQNLCQRFGDCSEDTSDDNSHDSSECDEAEADCALAICDTTAACRDASCEEVICMSDDSSDMSEQEPDTHVIVSSGANGPDKTLSVMQSLEEEFPPEVGPGSGSHGSRRSSHGRTGVRGIVMANNTSYAACQHIGIFGLESKIEPDLATALDHLAIITVLKQRVQHGVLDGGNFEDCMRRAWVETESEVGVEAMEDLGLKFFLSLRKSYWIGRHMKVTTPRIACLETALAYRRRFAELQQALSHRGVVSPGLLNRLSIADLEDNWHRFSALYIEACCGLGETQNIDASSPKSKEAVAKRLATLVEANSAEREKQLRAWNCRQMLLEERLQRQAARKERAALLRNRRAMSREDRNKARHQKLPSELVKNLVRRWERLQSQRRRREAAVLQQERAKQRAAARVELKQRAAARVELRRCRMEREERWRWLNRPDLTMADLLGQRGL
ncbi:unnamed protein product [Polarella glacialis]|uniref:J domain-containing protein n=1 Tax=Polarella glacialis TaxID=89957 RepID=A0A813LG11_POLGL|nr:unnamed protein product [Polarella glacialis]